MGTFYWPNSANIVNDVDVTITNVPVAYTVDGTVTPVNIDTATPGLSTPLPTILYDSSGSPAAGLATEATLSTLLATVATETTLTGVATEFTQAQIQSALTNLEATIEGLGALQQRVFMEQALPAGSNELGLVQITDGTDVVSVNADGSINTATTFSPGAEVGITGSGNSMIVNPDGSLDVNVLDGTVTITPIQFSLDGTPTVVSQDTGTPGASTPLPTRYLDTGGVPVDLATEATLSTLNGKIPALGQAAMAASLPVVIASNQSNLNVVVASALPAGNNNIGDVDVTNLPTTVDTNTGNASASTLRVVLATNQPAVPTSQSVKTAVTHVRTNYVSSPVTTSAYTQIVASLSAAVSEIEIFDSSGQTLVLATGAAASEVDQVYIFPGGNGRIPLSILSGVRVSIKAVSASATVGEQDINFYSL